MVTTSILLPTAHRPKSVMRALNCVFNQKTQYSWELFFAGDNAPYFDELTDSAWFLSQKHICEANGNKVHIWNDTESAGGPHAIINHAITLANSKYFMFYADDDFIKPNHIENYTSAIQAHGADLVYFDTKIVENKAGTKVYNRCPVLQGSRIGHSEIIVNTATLKQAPPHESAYGHDWHLIKWFIDSGKTVVESKAPPTYVVCVHKTGGFKGEPSDPWDWHLDV